MKGVFALNPTLPGRQLRWRASQRKFGSPHPMLEVNNIASWIPYDLTR